MAGFTFGKGIEKTIRQSAGDIIDRSTCAANSTATGLGIKSANLGKIAKFTITSRDSQSRQRKRGGDVYAVKLNKGECEVKVDVKDNGNGTSLAEYTVPYQDFLSDMILMNGGQGRLGQYTLSVCLRGAHIEGSPFVVQLQPTVFFPEWEKKLIFRGHSFKAAEKNTNKRNGMLSTYWHSFYIQQSKLFAFGVRYRERN